MNGGFDISLAPWAASTTTAGTTFAYLSGAASVHIAAPGLIGSAYDIRLALQQNITAVPSGSPWYFVATIRLTQTKGQSLLGSSNGCQLNVTTDGGDSLWGWKYGPLQTQNGAVNASGTLASAATRFNLLAACAGTADIVLAFDDVGFFVYGAS